MINNSIIKCSILLFIVTLSVNSCNKPEGKDPIKNESNVPIAIDTAATQVQTPPSANSQDPHVVPMPSTGTMPQLSQSVDVDHLAPIGSVPLLHPQQLVEFHPKLPDFLLSTVQEIDKKDEAQSIIFFKLQSDTSHKLKSTIIDINEKGASKLIKEMAHYQKAGHETRVVDGESITSYYIDIKGMPAIKAYIPSKSVATLYILVGDHRAVVLREEKVTSADHLVAAAKTIDFKKFETLSRN